MANKLRARDQNIEILCEEKRDLERKLARLEEYKERATRLQGELEAAKQDGKR
jgi:mitotic spindle assembly checkpoint protein MAD1